MQTSTKVTHLEITFQNARSKLASSKPKTLEFGLWWKKFQYPKSDVRKFLILFTFLGASGKVLALLWRNHCKTRAWEFADPTFPWEYSNIHVVRGDRSHSCDEENNTVNTYILWLIADNVDKNEWLKMLLK